MDHEAVVRHHMTEKYLLDELDPAVRDEFEGHFFDCPDCAVDVHAGALFVEQSKVVLAQEFEAVSDGLPAFAPVAVKPEWLAGLRARWQRPGLRPGLRPMFALPVLALLLVVIGYQNLVTYPHLQAALNSPQVLPWAQVNLGTYGPEGPAITIAPGRDFLLFVRIPPEGGYSSYTAELYNATGKLEWSLTSLATAGQEQWAVQVPGANREAGNYILKVRGVTATGERKEVGRASFELQIQK